MAWVSTERCEAQEASNISGVKSSARAEAPPVATAQLKFAFEGAPWREVMKWLATTSDLALHIADLPTGSFTYSDSRSFTPQEAIDRINLFLLPEGYTLVRSGRLLSVIDLSDPRSLKQLHALAKRVDPAQLDQYENNSVMKCFFALNGFTAEEAVEELTSLNLMLPPAVFPKTNQLLITDTVSNLRNAKVVLDAFEPTRLDNGTVVKSFSLQSVDAEDVLVVARPHLGLATGEMIGIDVSVSADPQGRTIFVTGVADKVQLIEGLIATIDKPDKAHTDGKPELQLHLVKGGNIELVHNVLQTLLSGKESVRLSMDQQANGIVALATPAVQNEIAATVTQLQASESVFEVIQLKTVDPYFAVSLLQGMLKLSGAQEEDGGDADRPMIEPAKVDADPTNMRLFVRGKQHQIEQIKKIVAGLDNNTFGNSTHPAEDMRLYPLRGKNGEDVLRSACAFWRGRNAIILFRAGSHTARWRNERIVSEKLQLPLSRQKSAAEPKSPSSVVLTKGSEPDAPIIRCQLTPRGLLIQSEDTQALGQFEQLLRSVSGPATSMLSEPVVFYLKYTKPDDAVRMLADLLDGQDATNDHITGAPLSGYLASTTSLLGSLVSSREGMTTMTAGTMTVVADSRLNRVIVQGTADDVERVDGYLQVIDKNSSLTSVETYGTSHVIALEHVRASEVAEVLRGAYGERVQGGKATASTGTQRGAQQRETTPTATKSRKPDSETKKPAPKAAAKKPTRNLEPRMTVAVHESSNSLVVTAPDQLFQEVEQLAKLLDARSKKSVVVIPTDNAIGQLMILRAFAEKAASQSRAKGQSSRSDVRTKSER
jgi:type II secretory pathway component GspD/PulD (secretin)